MQRGSLPLLFTVGFTLVALPARAIIVAPSDNQTIPTPVNGNGQNLENNVGTFNGASGIYIGNGWVLTADHVGAGNPNFDGTTYSYDGTSGQQLTTPDSTGVSDLYLFHLTTSPPLPSMNLSSTSGATLAASATSVVMYGDGQGLTSTTVNYYNTATNPYTVSSIATPELGYSTGSGMALRAGANFIDNSGVVNDGVGPTTSIITYFNPLYHNGGGTIAGAQAAVGDSGSAVFAQTASGSYQLVGMTFAAGSDLSASANQPASNTIVYNSNSFTGDGTTTSDSITAAADISAYLPQIEAVTGVPEPSTAWLLGVPAAAVLALGWRRSGATQKP